MGYGQALDMAEQVREGMIPLGAAIRWHLESNHYPPVGGALVLASIKAVKLASQGMTEETVDIRPGVHATVSVIIERFHLEPFVEGK